VDFSARAVVTVDPALDAYQIRIPKKSFIRLYYLEYLRYLKFVKEYSLDKVKFLVKKSETEEEVQLEYIEDFITYYFKSSDTKSRLVIMNRVPSLWRFSVPIVEIIGINIDDIITVSPMIIEAMNMDFDGDTASIFKLHDISAQKEAYDNAFQLNCITYDHNNQFLAQIKNEAIYAFNVLALSSPVTDPAIKINNLDELPFDYELLLDLNRKVDFNGTEYSYGVALLNKFAGLNDIQISSKNTSQDLSRFIYGVSSSNEDYHSRLSEFNRKLNWVLSCHRTQPLTFELEESCTILNQCLNNDILKKLPDNPYIGNYIYHGIVDKVVETIPKAFKLTKLLKAKFKKQQFSRSVIAIGYVSSEKNEVYKTPINATLLGGLNEEDFFISSIGTRKGICDKQSLTPKSGYLCRSLVMNLSPLEIDEEDCKTQFGFKIKILNKRHARMFINRYFKINFNDPWTLVTDPLLLIPNQEYIFRSPITCQTSNYKLCKKCFGEYEVTNKRYVGIHTAQVVSEKLTQLSIK
jgi:hypothetical protein